MLDEVLKRAYEKAAGESLELDQVFDQKVLEAQAHAMFVAAHADVFASRQDLEEEARGSG